MSEDTHLRHCQADAASDRCTGRDGPETEVPGSRCLRRPDALTCGVCCACPYVGLHEGALMNEFRSVGPRAAEPAGRPDEEPAAGEPLPAAGNGASNSERGRQRRPLSCLAAVVLALAVVAGGVVWLLRDDVSHPFGDARACEGSEVQLPGVIVAGGAPIPEGASDVHYFTSGGTAEVTFASNLIPEYLHRAGLLPEDASPFDERYGTKGVAEDEAGLPEGLCGSALRAPVRIYHRTGEGPGV
ncbi:hypothetical protein, partial [Streptomyces sp. NPDC059900]